MRTEIRIKNGLLSNYGLACGYIDIWHTGSSTTDMYKENNVYHVRQFTSNVRNVWETYHTLSEARKRFIQLGGVPLLNK